MSLDSMMFMSKYSHSVLLLLNISNQIVTENFIMVIRIYFVTNPLQMYHWYLILFGIFIIDVIIHKN